MKSPTDAVKPRRSGRIDPVDHLALGILDHQGQGGGFLQCFLFKPVPTRIRIVASLFLCPGLRLAPLLRQGLEAVAQVIGEHCAMGRVGCRKETIAP